MKRVFPLIIFLFLLIAALSFSHRVHADATPTPTDVPGCAPDKGDCENASCCQSSGDTCIKTTTTGEHGYVCASCQLKAGDTCVPQATGAKQCCMAPLSCLQQVSGSIICVDLTLPTGSVSNPCPSGQCDTGLGISIATNPAGFVQTLFRVLLSMSGGISLLFIIYAGYKLSVSQGNPEKVQQARETLTSAIVGLLFIIFSLTILQIIGVNILGLGAGGSGDIFFK